MPRSAPRTSGPWRDPRLTDREGDLIGPSSFVLVLLLMCVVLGTGGLLLGMGRMVPSVPVSVAAPSTTTPRPSPTIASAVPTATSGPPSVEPSTGAGPGVGPLLVDAGQAAPVTEAGREVGTVTLVDASYRSSIPGQDLPPGDRWLRVRLTYRATLPMTYESGRWSSVDADGVRHPWTGARTAEAALGSGTLQSGASRTGYVVLDVPGRVASRSLVLQDADGRDIIIVSLP